MPHPVRPIVVDDLPSGLALSFPPRRSMDTTANTDGLEQALRMDPETNQLERDLENSRNRDSSAHRTADAGRSTSRCQRLRSKELCRQADHLRHRAAEEPEGFWFPSEGMRTMADAIDTLRRGGDLDMASKVAFLARAARVWRLVSRDSP